MLSLINTLSLIRYLLVLRVNSPIARVLPRVASEISQVLGTIITDRLPSSEAKFWRKSAEYWSAYPELSADSDTGRGKSSTDDWAELRAIPSSPWPLESVVLPYPGKRSYGEGEPILVELKLLGESADHAFFLELILPALEHAGMTMQGDRSNKYPLWGHFDIEMIYVARGLNWEPMTQGGRLNLHYRPTPIQWAEGLTFQPPQHHRQHVVLWLTPFEFADYGIPDSCIATPTSAKHRNILEIPSLLTLLEAAFERIGCILPGKQTSVVEIWAMLTDEEQTRLRDEIAQMRQQPRRRQRLEEVPKEWPECWLGVQRFASIPASVLPYLWLASILHIGNHTHVGYGTFALR